MESPLVKPLQSQIRFEELPPVVWQKSLPSHLTTGNVEVWRFNLNSYLNQIQGFYKLLGSEEQARSARFLKEKDRQKFIVAKALLRLLLGKYLQIDPRDISFEYSEKMKPRVKNPSNLNIHFNVAHSGQCILIGVADEEVGIDVEYYEEATLLKSDMDLLFSEAEVSFINNQHSPVEAYHKLWTRKEALLKGTSQGIINELRLVPCLNGIHVLYNGVINSCLNWSVFSFEADKFCTASVAFTGLNKKLTFKELDENK